MKRSTFLRFLCALLLVFAAVAHSAQEKTYIVGFHPYAPFVIAHSDGTFTGFDIDLLTALANEVGIQKIKYVNAENIPNLVHGVSTGKFDLAIGGISITSEREASGVDFSYPYFDSGLDILTVSNSVEMSWAGKMALLLQFHNLKSFISIIFSFQVLEVWIGLMIFLIAWSLVYWTIERGKSVVLKFWPGLAESWYLSNVTSATVGYGDVTPKTWTGKILVITLMTFGVAFFANLTGLMSAEHTTIKMERVVNGPKDLYGKKVATKEGTTSLEALVPYGANVTAVPQLEDAYQMLLNHEVDAVVTDRPILLYYSMHDGAGKTEMVGKTFDPQKYGIMFKENSETTERINRMILKMQEDGRYDKIYTRWFGGS